MKLGIGLPNTLAGVDRGLLLDWAREAEAGPFEALVVLDRFRYDSYEPLTTLAAVAAVTETIELATMIIIGPLRNTAVLAKSATTLQKLSDGRFTLGIAVGARVDDYEVAGVPYRERGRRISRQLAELRHHWETGAMGPHLGETPRPGLMVGGYSEITFARVARFADGYMHGGGPPHIFARFADKARAAWRDVGRPGRPLVWGMGYFAFGDAAAAGADYLRDYYAFTGPFAERIADGLLTTPQAVRQFVRGYADAGCDALLLFPTDPALSQLDRLAGVVG